MSEEEEASLGILPGLRHVLNHCKPAKSCVKLCKNYVQMSDVRLVWSERLSRHRPGTCVVVVRGGTRLSTVLFRGDGHAWAEEAEREEEEEAIGG